MTRVVIAEDDPAIAEPLARALVREGYDIQVAPDGLQALSEAQAGADLLILDLGLPELDGLEVCRQLRSVGSAVPILVLTVEPMRSTWSSASTPGRMTM